MQEPPPLMLCMEKDNGDEVTVQIDAGDDFHCFLRKAKALLGYDVDINSVTRNQPVALTDNIYQFLIKNEKGLADEICKALLNNEDYYVLEDGTQIRASQIHFDNEDLQLDLTAEKIPFVRISDVNNDVETQDTAYETKFYNIAKSPVRFPNDNGPFFIPFKLINRYNKQPSGFEAQFHKYLNKTYTNLNPVANRNKSPRSLINENYKKYDENGQIHSSDLNHYTREDILNIYKDTAVPTVPYENPVFLEKPRHVRKSNPSRLFHKNLDRPLPYIDANGVLISEIDCEKCVVCSKYVPNTVNRLQIFDNEDRRVHGTRLRAIDMQSKIICAQCLTTNFKPGRVKGPKKYLKPNEYLVIRNGKQYIFEKDNPVIFNQTNNDEINSEVQDQTLESKSNGSVMTDKSEYVNQGLDGEIETKSVNKRDDDTIVQDERKESASDVEVIEKEPEFGDVENLDDVDEEVIEFLGKYQCDSDIKELKCRFCDKLFKEINEVIDHGTEHKHDMDDGAVYPCPLCDYGYDDIKWLKGHLKAAHDKSRIIKLEDKEDAEKHDEENKEPEETEDSLKTNIGESNIVIKTEVKQEAIESSDDEIWIVQTADDEAERQLNVLLNAAKKNHVEKISCDTCSQVFRSIEAKNGHKCRRGRKRKFKDEEIIVPCSEDFLRRAQGKIRTLHDSGDKHLVVRPKKKRNKELSSDPQIVTCHNCNESFTSKVRLKFHMQFHDTTNMLTPEGEYKCAECDGTTFQSETALFDHVHFQHHKQRRWQCPVAGCGKTFYLRATLTKHSRMHTDTRRYVCGTCGKRFLDKQTLDEHGVTHLQIKPYQCHVCLKQLTRRSRLRMHLRAHEEELVPTAVLGCAGCGRAFRGAGDMQEHLTNFPECIEEFSKELKKEESVTVQLSPTTGIVRHTGIVESPRVSVPLQCQASGPKAEALLNQVPEAARPIIRCLLIEKAFRCEYCEDVFYSELGLNSHRANHKGVKNPFVCHICKVSFATYSRCTTHKTTHGFYKRPLAEIKKQQDKCTQDAVTSSTGILGYGDFPVVKHFLCEDCGRSYLHWTYLQVHRRMKHATDNSIHQCEQCHMSFPNSWGLSYHRKKMHTRIDQGDVTKPKGTLLFRMPCRDCNETFTNKTALYKHRNKQHKDAVEQSSCCNYNPVQCLFPYTSGAKFGSNHGEFSNQTQTEAEKDDDTTVVQFVCEVCKKGFPTRTELTVHANAHAPNAITAQGIRVHMCGWCSRAFRTQSALAEHVRSHTGERPFPCDVCGMAFRRVTAMRNHRLIHSGVRDFVCAQCPKKFKLRSDLRMHCRLNHPSRLVVTEGMPSFIPTTAVALQMLSNNSQTQVVCEPNQMAWRGPNMPGVSNVSIMSNITSVSLPRMSEFPNTPNFAYLPNTSDASNGSKMSNISNNSNKSGVPSMCNMLSVSTLPRISNFTNMSNISNMARLTSLPRMSNMPRMSTFSMSDFYSKNVSNVTCVSDMSIVSNMADMSSTTNVANDYVSDMTNLSNMTNMSNTTSIANYYVSNLPNMSSLADMQNVSFSADMQNVSYTADMENVSCSADMPNVSFSPYMSKVSCSADMPNVSCSADVPNVSYTTVMSNVSCSTDMPNVSCSADMPNVSYTADM